MSTIVIDTAAKNEFIYIWGSRCNKVFAAYQIRIDGKVVKRSGGLSTYDDASLAHSDAVTNALRYLEGEICDRDKHDLIIHSQVSDARTHRETSRRHMRREDRAGTRIQ